MELRDYWRVVRHRWRIVMAGTLLGLLVAATITLLTPPRYEARAELFVASEVSGTTSELMQGSSFLLDRVKSYVEIVDKAVVLAPVIEDLGLPDNVAELSERVGATVVPETVVVQLHVQDDNAEDAATIANAVAEEFINQALLLEPARADETAIVRITVIDPARAPTSPIRPQPELNLAFGLLLGLAGGFAGAILRDALDRRVKGERDIKALTAAPLIGAVPLDSRVDQSAVIPTAHTASVRAEAIRRVRTNLQFIDFPTDARSYVVTSALTGEGKTLTSINLAAVIAESGQKVCLVEADLRRPRIGEYLGVESSVGLTDVLIGKYEWQEVLQEYRPNLDVIVCGTVPPNPAELASGEIMESLLRDFEGTYDVVVVDSPPLLPVTDAAVLSKRTAGAIVVVNSGRRGTPRGDVAQALDMLGTVGARVLGIVLNRVPQTGPNAAPISSYTLQDK